MTQSFEVVAKFDERAEAGESRNLPFNDVARFVRGNKIIPGVRFQILDRKRHSAILGIDAGNHRINCCPFFKTSPGCLMRRDQEMSET